MSSLYDEITRRLPRKRRTPTTTSRTLFLFIPLFLSRNASKNPAMPGSALLQRFSILSSSPPGLRHRRLPARSRSLAAPPRVQLPRSRLQRARSQGLLHASRRPAPRPRARFHRRALRSLQGQRRPSHRGFHVSTFR